MRPDTPTAFFSYSREDSGFALRLSQDLKAAGANVWIDQLDIEPGQEWDSAIEAAVTQSQRMLLILSPASVKSRNVRNEISFALEENKTIIPVLYQDCTVPLQLHRVQYVDLRNDYSRGLVALLRTLGVDQRGTAGARVLQTEPQTYDVRSEPNPREQHQRAPDKRPVVQERGDKSVSRYSAWMKAVVALCPILIAASILYWTRSHLRESQSETQRRQVQVAQNNRGSAQPAGPQLGGTAAPNESVNHRRETEAGTAVKPASHESLARQSRAAPQGIRTGDDQTAKQLSKAGGRHEASPLQPASPAVPSEGALPADLDPTLADLYHRAQGGDKYALVSIGASYQMQQDYPRAVTWYRKAAEAGSTFGMTSLGEMYENGRGVDKDYKQAAYWYRKAAEAGSDQGSRDGMYYLGVLYENGRGVNQDSQLAQAWYRKAANLGLLNAEIALKRLGESSK